MTQRYPLTWPPGRPRTPDWKRRPSPFKTTPAKASAYLEEELRRLGARNVIISSNLKLRQDGYPYAQQPRNADEGIAVYFSRKGRDMAFACDTFAKREDNMHAIAKTIDALRGIERWGSSDMMEQAFTGFTALPAPAQPRWWVDLGVPADAPSEVVEKAYRQLRAVHHPDRGGDADSFRAVQAAWDQYQEGRRG